MKITNYIIIHDQFSLNWFIQYNPDIWHKFEFILVGNKDYKDNFLILSKDKLDKFKFHFAKDYPDNIEDKLKLLAFTAWYLIVNNDICQTPYVGLFEYDVIFSQYPDFKPEKNTIYGFCKRMLPDEMYLKAVPELRKLLYQDDIYMAENHEYWNAGSNFIMSKNFLFDFTAWYLNFVIDYDLLSHRLISHYHERLVNFYAVTNEVNNISLDILTHKELLSHGIKL